MAIIMLHRKSFVIPPQRTMSGAGISSACRAARMWWSWRRMIFSCLKRAISMIMLSMVRRVCAYFPICAVEFSAGGWMKAACHTSCAALFRRIVKCSQPIIAFSLERHDSVHGSEGKGRHAAVGDHRVSRSYTGGNAAGGCMHCTFIGKREARQGFQ